MRGSRARQSLYAATALCAAWAMPAFGQEADEAADEGGKKEDIVVVGTLIRGTTAVGSQTLSVDSQEIIERGASSTNELLGAIPQISNAFNGRFEVDPRGVVGSGTSINRPNLRNLPGVNQTSGGLTLVLIDGMRATPLGVNQASIDPDVLPAAVIEGLDVVTDGGSSLYGADAVAGVINFRTLRKFEGIKVDANYGFGTTIDAYDVWDASITAGQSWATGNAYVSVTHSERNGILNGQTDWASGQVFDAQGNARFSFTQCPNPVGTEVRFFKFGPAANQFTSNPAAPGAGTFPIGTPCDATAGATYLPKQERTSVFAALSQQVADNIDLRVTAYFTKRDTDIAVFPRGFTTAAQVFVPPANNPPPGTIVTILGGTSFSFSPNAAYENTPNEVGFETWGVTPELTFDVGGEWLVRSSAHFGRSTNYQSFPNVDTVRAQAAVNAGLLNPRNVAAANADVINSITNFTNAQETTQELFMFRTVADGPLFALPGGDAKLAVGIEYQDNNAESRLSQGPFGSISAVPFMKSVRNAKSVFAEVSLPVFSFIDLNGSLRFDDYSDFGSTTNPSIGFDLKPVSWLSIYGHWNTSFNAPTAIDNLAIGTGRFACGIYVAGSTNPAQRPVDPLGRDTSRQGTCALVLQGSRPNLRPQTAESYAIGFNATPMQGLRFGGQFYSIDLDNALGALNPSIVSTYTTNPELYTYNVTASQYAAILDSLTNGAALGAQQVASNIGLVVDTRITNLNAATIEGIDFNLSYQTESSIGRLAFGVSGTKQTKAILTTGGVTTNQLGIGSPEFSATGFVGWNNGAFSARVTLNYSGKFRDQAVNNLGQVEVVDPFVTANLFFGYDIGESGGVLNGTSFRLIVDNVFEEEPQTIRRANTNNLSYNNFTLGRVIKLGVSRKF
jgi:iron complex outermembrane receptor protein